MKQVVRNIVAIVALCMISAMAWADGDVKFVYQFNGQETLASSPGSITSEKSGTTCTLTVTPQERNYLISISAVRTIAGTNGQIRTRTPEVDESEITVTPADANADKSGVTTWTLTMPESPYDVQVTANFGSRTSIDGTVLTLSATSFTYDGTAKEPTVTKISDQNGTELKLTAGTDYTIAYSNNTNVPGADDPQPTVTVTGINGYTGTVSAEFTIEKAAITVTAPTAIANLTYTGKAQALVNAGTASAGTLQYKLGANGAYGTTIPTGTDAGTYEVFYQVVGDANHSDVAEAGPLAVTIAKAGITPTVSITGWTYGATANNPEVSGNTGKGSVAFTYATKGTETFSETVPTDAGEYTVKATIAETTNYNGAEATADFTISKATPTVTAPTAKTGLTFTEKAQELVNAGTTTAGTLQYKLGTDGTYGTSIPTATNAGDYAVYYKVVGDGNYSDVAEAGPINVTIAKVGITPTVSITGWTYGATANTPTVSGNTGKGSVAFTYATKGTETFSETVPTDAGEYTVKATIAETTNYNGAEATADFTISKATPTVTAPTAISDLAYTGNAQALVNAGSTTGGTLQYKLGANGAYGTSIPTGTDAGTYAVYYKVVGDNNYYDVAEAGPVNVTIAQTNITPTVSITGWTYGATANTPTVSGNTGKGSVAFTYATKGTETFSETVPTDAGEYTVKATIAATANYNGAEATADFIISPAQITGITLKQTALIYNGKDQTVEISSVTAGTLTISENDLTGQTGFSSLFDISGDTQKEKGSYTVTLTAKANSNFSGSATADFTISYNSITEDALGIPAGQVYGTYFSSNMNYELPEKVMAYIITGVNGTNTVLEEINYIPVGVPVLLEKKETAVETRTATNPDTKDNWLHHADKETTISRSTGTAYYLYNGMFIRATENKAAANNNYLIVPASSQAPVRALNIGHGDGTTGIESLGSTESSNDERWYDLQGRRIERPAKTGLYILNGKKVVIR